jgi:hypothetical protein
MYNATWKAWDGHIEFKECKNTIELDSFIELWTGHIGHINYDDQICCAIDGRGVVTWEVVPLSFDCLSCGEMILTNNEDDVIYGVCPHCIDGDYPNTFDLLPRVNDDTCTCEDRPCCVCNSESGQTSVLFAVIVIILAVVLYTAFNTIVLPMLAVLRSI